MKKFTQKFKDRIVSEVISGKLTGAQAIRKYKLNEQSFYGWKRNYLQEHGFNVKTHQNGTVQKDATPAHEKTKPAHALEIEYLRARLQDHLDTADRIRNAIAALSS